MSGTPIKRPLKLPSLAMLVTRPSSGMLGHELEDQVCNLISLFV
jgi:hypothetical protein